MDPTTGKLFGAIGAAEDPEDPPAFLFADAANRVVSGWYTLQWLRCYDRAHEGAGNAEASAVPAKPD